MIPPHRGIRGSDSLPWSGLLAPLPDPSVWSAWSFPRGRKLPFRAWVRVWEASLLGEMRGEAPDEASGKAPLAAACVSGAAAPSWLDPYVVSGSSYALNGENGGSYTGCVKWVGWMEG